MLDRKNENFKNYYELEEKIYEGIHSIIYKCKEKNSNESRAIKIIDLKIIKDEISKQCNNSEIDKRIQDYIEILILKFENMKECSYNNINSVKYYEYFISENEFIIIMELCDDKILNLLNKNKKGFEPEEILKIMINLNSTFRSISKKNIILNSLEFENILIKYDDINNNSFIVKLSNYGTPSIKNKKYAELLSKAFPEKYVEQTNYEKNNYDLWNIGIIIYRLFFIESPVEDNNKYKIKKIHKTGDKTLDDLIKNLLINDDKKRLDWERYFLHPFLKKNYIEIAYKINPNDNKIKLFGDQFIINNEHLKNKISIIFEKKLYDFEQYFNLKNIEYTNKGTLTIKLAGVDEFIDVSHMFDSCESLVSLSKVSNWDSSKIINMKCMFNRCKNLKSLPDINLLNTSQVTNMSFLFSRCKSLISLPDISIWDTSNVKNMSYMFYMCKSLKSLPNISKWDASNVIKISNAFFKCKSLSSIPNIFVKDNKSSFRGDFKIIVIGNSDTNKVGYVNKYTKNIFSDTYKATIVSEFGFKIFEYGDSLYRIQLWDLAGQDKNSMVIKIFAKDAHGAVIMSNATNISSRDYAIIWKNSLDETAKFQDGKELPCILVENNIELLDDDSAFDPTLDEFCKNNGFIKGFRVSSRKGINIKESMEFLIKKIIKRIEIILEKSIDEDDETDGKTSTNNNHIFFGQNNYSEEAKQRNKDKKCVIY